MRILVVEDEAPLREDLVRILKMHGYAVDQAGDGPEGLHYGSEYDLDAAIIDLGLPDLPGIELIKALRARGRNFPILILTAHGRWQDKVEGLEAGADDYVVKPFHMEELLARVKALVRRSAGWSQPVLKFGPISLDLNKQVVSLNGAILDLTAYEYRVIEYLMLHPGKVVSKTELTNHMYQQDFDRDSNVIEVFVKRLRNKLDPEGNLGPIETLRGRGYRFTLPSES
ncbi:MAG: response regulator transcription factor [Gammaproteobacteria bacterium]|nr:response regulator transcription factor [Gammaproteobacteria bacterium]